MFKENVPVRIPHLDLVIKLERKEPNAINNICMYVLHMYVYVGNMNLKRHIPQSKR